MILTSEEMTALVVKRRPKTVVSRAYAQGARDGVTRILKDIEGVLDGCSPEEAVQRIRLVIERARPKC